MKKTVALLLVVLMFVSVLAACGSANGTQETSTQSTTAAATQQTTEKPAEPVTIVMQRPLWGNADPESEPNAALREKIKTITGIDVQIVGQQNPSDQTEKPNLMIAAGEKLDIFQTPYSPGIDWRKYKASGAIIPLNDLLDKYGQDILKNVDKDALKACTDSEGKIWALPDECPTLPRILYLRKDWLDAEKLDVPVTMEDYEKAFEVFKTKYNAEGLTPSEPNIEEMFFAGSFIPTGDQRYLDTDGKLKPHFTHPGYKDFLAKMAEWYKKGYLHKEYSTMQYQQAMDTFYAGRVGMMLTWFGGNYGRIIDDPTLQANVPGAKMIVAAPPKGPTGSLITKMLPIVCNIMITSTSENPDAAMKFLNWSCGTDEGYTLTAMGEKDVTWKYKDEANFVFEYTDKRPDPNVYGWPIFTSARLNAFTLKYAKDSKATDGTDYYKDQKVNPSSFAIDAFTPYDLGKMKSANAMATLNTILTESKAKIIMGLEPVSSWDKTLEKWYNEGGTQLIEDYTEQYNANK